MYNWLGEYCNVIEKSRASELALEIQTKKDVGCTGARRVITLTGESPLDGGMRSLLGAGSPRPPGHPAEDEIYEAAITQTFTAYTLQGNSLQPLLQTWGKIPSIQVLDPHQVYN